MDEVRGEGRARDRSNRAYLPPPKGGFGSQTAPPFAPPTAPRTCGGRESRHRGLIGRAAALDGAQRPFLRVPGAFRVFYGPQDRPGSTISGLRGVRVGWRPGRAAGSAAITRARRGAPSSSPCVRPTITRPGRLPATARWALLRAARGSVFAGGRRAGEGGCRPPSIPLKMHAPMRAKSRATGLPRWLCLPEVAAAGPSSPLTTSFRRARDSHFPRLSRKTRFHHRPQRSSNRVDDFAKKIFPSVRR